jgi:hypothetical protein
MAIPSSISVLPREGGSSLSCPPAEVLARLLDDGRLPHFIADFGEPSSDGLADCHQVAIALMVDLFVAGCVAGWKWCEGTSEQTGRHSWVEFEGWAIDASNGHLRGGALLIADAAWYRSHGKFEGVIARDSTETRLWLQRRNRKNRRR